MNQPTAYLFRLLNELLDQSTEVARQLKKGDGDLKKIEKITLRIIAEDNFDSFPNSVQDAIYFIDMHDIENPSAAEMESATKNIKLYLDGVNNSHDSKWI